MTRKELSDILQQEKILYLGDKKNCIKRLKKARHKRYYIWKYLYYFRLCQYYAEQRHNAQAGRFTRKTAKTLFGFYERKKNVFSYKSGVEIGLQCKIGKNCDIWHSGVVINGTIGDDCVFHGNNIIGNKGIQQENKVPQLENNVDVGAGAMVLGDVFIAHHSIIGAGAVVTKSFEQPKSIIIGVPGRLK